MINKKGDSSFFSNVLTVVIAVIGLAIIGFAVFKIYQASVNQDSVNAQKIIDVLEVKINLLQDNQSGRALVQGFKGSENWYLAGWDVRDSSRPDKCALQSCICICKGGSDFEKAKDECQQNGFCRKFDVSINMGESVVVTDYSNIKSYPSEPGGQMVYGTKVVHSNVIKIGSAFTELIINKTLSGVSIARAA